VVELQTQGRQNICTSSGATAPKLQDQGSEPVDACDYNSSPCDYLVSELTGLCHVAGGSLRGRRLRNRDGRPVPLDQQLSTARRLQPQFAVTSIILSELKPLQHHRPCFSSRRSFLVQGREPQCPLVDSDLPSPASVSTEINTCATRMAAISKMPDIAANSY
jgi:hypothetical protein